VAGVEPDDGQQGPGGEDPAGTATAAELANGGATQLGVGGPDDYAPCAVNGLNCVNDIYAVSLPGVASSRRAREGTSN